MFTRHNRENGMPRKQQRNLQLELAQKPNHPHEEGTRGVGVMLA